MRFVMPRVCVCSRMCVCVPTGFVINLHTLQLEHHFWGLSGAAASLRAEEATVREKGHTPALIRVQLVQFWGGTDQLSADIK